MSRQMTERDHITSTARNLLALLPRHVTLIAAAKSRSIDEVLAAIEGGIQVVGHNYVQEARQMVDVVGRRARWHLIGALQRNKAKQAVELFDMIETIDSWALAEAIDSRCAAFHRTMPVLIEINSGREANKSGVLPEQAEPLVRRIGSLSNLRVQGLMTMGPFSANGEDYRPYFRATKALFDELARAQIPGVEMRCLSMGMSDSYMVAVEEGANIVRIGAALFGPRPHSP